MAGSPRDNPTTRGYEEIPSNNLLSDLNANKNPQTVRDYQSRIENLNRENFDLKLRIFFLEQNGSNQTTTTTTPIPRSSSQFQTYDPQQHPFSPPSTDYHRSQLRSPLSPIRHSPHLSNPSEIDDIHSVRDRPDNEYNRRPIRHSEDSGAYVTTIDRDSTIQTYPNRSPIDSHLPTEMSTNLSHLPVEERERRILDENTALKQENNHLKARMNEVSDEYQHLREQYQIELRTNEDQQTKADRVLKRIKADYDARIANLQEEHRQQLGDYQSYRHEQEQTNSNVNIEEYLRKIDQQDRLIKQLNDRLNETSIHDRTPQVIPLPSSIDPQLIDENTRRLHEYAETIDQLRAECDELRRSEKYLRKQVEELNRLFDPSSGRLPPLPRSSIIDDTQEVEDPQAAIIHTSLLLRNDAENVSALTNRIAQIIRDREENQNKLKEKEAQLRSYEAREAEFESRTVQKFDLQIASLQHDIQELEKQIEANDRRIEELTEENAQLKSQSRRDLQDLEHQSNRQKQNLQEQLDSAKERIAEIQEELEHQNGDYDTLRTDYETVKNKFDSIDAESLERTIQQQVRQIQTYEDQLQQLGDSLDQQKVHLERERDFERGKAEQNQTELDLYRKRYDDLQTEYDKLRPILDEQKNKYDNQIRTYQANIEQMEQERDNLHEEIDLLRLQKQEAARQGPENHPQYIELAEANKEFQDRLARYEVRLRDNEDAIKHYQNQLADLQRTYETVTEHYEELQTNHQQTEDELAAVGTEKEHLNEQTTKLKRDLEELEIRIRLQINQEIDNEHRGRLNDLNERKDAEIDNIREEKEAIAFEIERIKQERTRVQNQLTETQDELQTARDTIENNEGDLNRLQKELDRRTEQLQDRIQDLEQQLQDHQNGRHVNRSTSPLFNDEELISQLENKVREQDDVIASLRNSRAISEEQSNEIQLRLQIRIQGLEDNLGERERFIENREKQICELKESDHSQIAELQALREELQRCHRQIEQILNEKNSSIDLRERQIEQLKSAIQTREQQLTEVEERSEEQQLENEKLDRQNKRLNQDREAYFNQIQDLEKALDMEKKTSNANASEQRDHYQNVIEDLKNHLKRRDDTIQRSRRFRNFAENLEHSLRLADDHLKKTGQSQSPMIGDNHRTPVSTNLTPDVESRDQMIASLREKSAEKDREITKLHEANMAKEQELNALYAERANHDTNSIRPQSGGGRVPNNAGLRFEIEQKDKEINDLKQQLARAQRSKPVETDASSISDIPRVTRPRRNFDHLNRDELLFELDMALQHNEDLNEQLRKKFPTITELHSQLVEVRNELARQKYVNQVLWRKLNALIDIHGSNTRNELALELANYQDELTKLKSQQNRTNDTRSAILNANSRSSSEQNLSTLSATYSHFPSKNIKSTIALLERANIEWQTKLARLTEQLGRSESQSRNSQRELIKYQKLLYDAGLTSSINRQRRRSADDSIVSGYHPLNSIDDDLTKLTDLDQLKEIIRNQRKYSQQLQTCVRLNKSDDATIEQIHNLNLVIDTYKHESDILKNELKKVYKSVEHQRKKSQQYEQLLKDQQLSIEQSKKKLCKYDQLLKKYDVHQPVFDDTKEHFMTPMDEYIIDLDIDIIDPRKKASIGKKDSGFSNATDATEHQRQIQKKDEQIQQLNNQLKERDGEIQRLATELKSSKKNYEDFQTPKSSKPDNEPQNQRLRDQVRHLQEELERTKPLVEHYKTQIDILERRAPAFQGNDKNELVIRSSELSQLLEEMRLLRRDLERSLQKQNELQMRLDENIRQSQSPREFTFTGRGVSYPDLRITDGSMLIPPENPSQSTPVYSKRSRPIGSSSTEFDPYEYPQLSSRDSEHPRSMKSYIIGEIRIRDELRRVVEDVKYDLKGFSQELKDKLRSRTVSSITDAYIRSLEERLMSLDERLTHALDLIDTYWRAELPERNRDDEHLFTDQRLLDENKQLLSAQRKYIRDAQILREKYKEQSHHLEQLLAQLTKVNRKKADNGDYLALLLRPTLDVLQKARSNIENHLKETNTNQIPPGSAQSRSRHRSNQQE